jgi:hypothetical protein
VFDYFKNVNFFFSILLQNKKQLQNMVDNCSNLVLYFSPALRDILYRPWQKYRCIILEYINQRLELGGNSFVPKELGQELFVQFPEEDEEDTSLLCHIDFNVLYFNHLIAALCTCQVEHTFVTVSESLNYPID